MFDLCPTVYGMVPFLNAIMGTMLPMLGMTKQDNMKWVFSSGKLNYRFAKSVTFYVSAKFINVNKCIHHSSKFGRW